MPAQVPQLVFPERPRDKDGVPTAPVVPNTASSNWDQADLAARTMFNVFPQGVGERVGGFAQPLGSTAMGVVNRFANPFGAMASDIGAARQAFSGTSLIGGRAPFQETATAPTPVLPSGTPMVGFDAYPTTPQVAASAPTKFPYGHALGPSIYTQSPTAIDLRTRMGGENAPYGFGQPSGFAGINPAPSVRPILFGGSGRTSISPEGVPVTVYPSRTDITGRVGGVSSLSLTPSTTPFVSAESLMGTTTQLPSALPLSQSMGVEGGPVSLTGATAMTAPKTAEQQGRTAIQTPYGVIYATADQQKNWNAGLARDLEKNQRMAQFQRTLAEIKANKPKLEQERMMASQRQDAERMARLLEGSRRGLTEQLQAEKERGGSGRDVQARLEQARVRQEIERQRAGNVGKFETVTDRTGRTRQRQVRTPFFSYEGIKMPTGETAYSGPMARYAIFKPYSGQAAPTTRSFPTPQSTVMASNKFMGYSPFSTEESPFGSIFGGFNPYGGGV